MKRYQADRRSFYKFVQLVAASNEVFISIMKSMCVDDIDYWVSYCIKSAIMPQYSNFIESEICINVGWRKAMGCKRRQIRHGLCGIKARRSTRLVALHNEIAASLLRLSLSLLKMVPRPWYDNGLRSHCDDGARSRDMFHDAGFNEHDWCII